jgi:PAS domain S-box-containing protein
MIRKNVILLTMAAMFFIAALWCGAMVVLRLKEASALALHTYKAIDYLDRADLDIQRAEDDTRSYVLSSRPELRDTVETDRDVIENDINRLERLMQSNPSELLLLQLLRREENAQLSFDADALRTADQSSRKAFSLISSDTELSLNQTVRNTDDQLRQQEFATLQKRTDDLNRMNLLAIPVVTVLVLSGLTLLLASMYISRASLKRESERGDELQRANAALRESQQLFDSFMQYTPALAWIKAEDGRILWCNQHLLQIIGLGPHQVIGKKTSEFMPYRADESEESDQAVRDGDTLVRGITLLRVGGGEMRYFLVSKFSIETARGNLIGGIALDVHDQHLAEQKVVDLNTKLLNHVRQLETARDKALEASSLKSAFVANISHEIRTPLSGIIGMNELLLNTELGDQQRSLAETVHESSLSLLTVLNDILDLSKIEAGKMTFELAPFKLRWLVDDSIRLMSAAAASKGLQLHLKFITAVPESVVGDVERLRQILLNLIGNAVKFTERGGVSVDVAVISEDEQTDEVNVKFAVTDTGIGISEEDRKYLFVPFAQVDNSSTRRFGGTGLGLTICSRLVDSMGGHIGVVSEPGVGSTFWFVLPFKRQVGPAVAKSVLGPVRQRPRDIGHRCVLIVEDNPVLQHLAVMQLTHLGISSRVARTGPEALEMIQAMPYDLILMDVHLPKMSGFEVTMRIREMDKVAGHHTPIVAMTAGAMEGDRQRCLAAGMDDYLSKPVSIDNLRRVLDHWVGDQPAQAKSA